MADAKSETPGATRKVNEITLVPYGDPASGVLHEPSTDDVQGALEKGALDERDFQRDLEELKAEWRQASNNDADAWAREVKNYHARRVAWFVTHGWNDPITIGSNNVIRDGSHRIRAAIFLGHEEIDVVVGG